MNGIGVMQCHEVRVGNTINLNCVWRGIDGYGE